MATHGTIPSNKDVGTNLAVLGPQTVASGGVAEALTNLALSSSVQATINAIQQKLDAAIAIINSQRNV